MASDLSWDRQIELYRRALEHAEHALYRKKKEKKSNLPNLTNRYSWQKINPVTKYHCLTTALTNRLYILMHSIRSNRILSYTLELWLINIQYSNILLVSFARWFQRQLLLHQNAVETSPSWFTWLSLCMSCKCDPCTSLSNWNKEIHIWMQLYHVIIRSNVLNSSLSHLTLRNPSCYQTTKHI